MAFAGEGVAFAGEFESDGDNLIDLLSFFVLKFRSFSGDSFSTVSSWFSVEMHGFELNCKMLPFLESDIFIFLKKSFNFSLGYFFENEIPL